LFLKNQFDSIGKVRAVKNTVAMAVKYTDQPEGQVRDEEEWEGRSAQYF
jgi:hypothetical protein